MSDRKLEVRLKGFPDHLYLGSKEGTYTAYLKSAGAIIPYRRIVPEILTTPTPEPTTQQAEIITRKRIIPYLDVDPNAPRNTGKGSWEEPTHFGDDGTYL